MACCRKWLSKRMWYKGMGVGVGMYVQESLPCKQVVALSGDAREQGSRVGMEDSMYFSTKHDYYAHQRYTSPMATSVMTWTTRVSMAAGVDPTATVKFRVTPRGVDLYAGRVASQVSPSTDASAVCGPRVTTMSVASAPSRESVLAPNPHTRIGASLWSTMCDWKTLAILGWCDIACKAWPSVDDVLAMATTASSIR